MTPHVMKRDGCKVPFKSERIKEAILRAAKAAEVDDADYCATVAAVVSEQMQGRNQVDINEIRPQLKTSDVGAIQTTGSCLHRVPSRSRH